MEWGLEVLVKSTLSEVDSNLTGTWQAGTGPGERAERDWTLTPRRLQDFHLPRVHDTSVKLPTLATLNSFLGPYCLLGSYRKPTDFPDFPAQMLQRQVAGARGRERLMGFLSAIHTWTEPSRVLTSSGISGEVHLLGQCVPSVICLVSGAEQDPLDSGEV